MAMPIEINIFLRVDKINLLKLNLIHKMVGNKMAELSPLQRLLAKVHGEQTVARQVALTQVAQDNANAGHTIGNIGGVVEQVNEVAKEEKLDFSTDSQAAATLARLLGRTGSAAPAPVVSNNNSSNNNNNNTTAPAPETKPNPIAAALATKFEWHEKQLEAFALAEAGASFCLIGAAGTGKTTTVQGIVDKLINSGQIGTLPKSTKVLSAGTPAIAFVSFTHRAVRRIAQMLPPNLKMHARTIHSLIEFEPEDTEVERVNDAGEKYIGFSRKFVPKRNALNPIEGLSYVVVEESSMVDVELFTKLYDACPGAKYIFLGDLNQIPPVFGDSCLGFKLIEYPVVELTHVYRQAAQSPVISLAHRVLAGTAITMHEQDKLQKDTNALTFHYWKSRTLVTIALGVLKDHFIPKLVADGEFDAGRDTVILCPFRKEHAVSITEINLFIANALDIREQRTVHEILSGDGRDTRYLAIGDKVLVSGRHEGVITNITSNAKYSGKSPKPASPNMTRWGGMRGDIEAFNNFNDEAHASHEDFDSTWNPLDMTEEEAEESEKAISSIIEVRVGDDESGYTTTIRSRAELKKLQFAWCVTVHQAQGSEWEKVYIITHHTHHFMWSRELLYTAVTRARKELYIVCEGNSTRAKQDSTLAIAPTRHKVKGISLAFKIKNFGAKIEKIPSNCKHAFAGALAIMRQHNAAQIRK